MKAIDGRDIGSDQAAAYLKKVWIEQWLVTQKTKENRQWRRNDEELMKKAKWPTIDEESNNEGVKRKIWRKKAKWKWQTMKWQKKGQWGYENWTLIENDNEGKLCTAWTMMTRLLLLTGRNEKPIEEKLDNISYWMKAIIILKWKPLTERKTNENLMKWNYWRKWRNENTDSWRRSPQAITSRTSQY